MSSEFIPPTAFVQMLVEKCGFEKRKVSQSASFDIHSLDLTSLKLKVNPESTPFAVPRGLSANAHITDSQLHELVQLLEKEGIVKGGAVIIVLGGVLQKLKPSTQALLAKSKVAVLSRNNFQGAYQSQQKAALIETVTTELVTRLGRQALSPYHSKIPATGGSFFGRAHILKTVFSVQDNFTFVGNRRIGKTSLLQEIKHRLKISGRKVFIADLYGAVPSTSHEVLTRLLKDLDPSGNFERHSTVHDISQVFRSTVLTLSQYALVVVLIDELDKILEFDQRNSNELMELFRDVFHKTVNTRFYAAGFRRARSSMRDVNTPLYGFTTPQIVERLSLLETKEMIEFPLLHMGIDVRRSPILEAIYSETAGHPELVQMCCSEIIRKFDESSAIPSPTDVLTEVFQSGDFREKVFGAFLANTNVCEQLASYLLMKAVLASGGALDSFDFDIAAIDNCLKSVGKKVSLAELFTITENLLTSGVLVQPRGGTRYRFAIPQLARYCQNYNLDFMIQKSLDEVGNLASWSEIIKSEPKGQQA